MKRLLPFFLLAALGSAQSPQPIHLKQDPRFGVSFSCIFDADHVHVGQYATVRPDGRCHATNTKEGSDGQIMWYGGDEASDFNGAHQGRVQTHTASIYINPR